MKKFLLLFVALIMLSYTYGQYLTESFEGTWSGTPAAPSGWTVIHTAATGTGSGTDPIYWAKNSWSGSAWSSTGNGTPTGPAGAYDGTAVAWYNDYNAKATQKDQLTTGLVDLTGSTNPRASFYLAISASSSLTLKLRGSADGGTVWGDIQTLAKPGVAWTKVTVAIPAMYKVANAKFGVEVTASWGSYDIWLDKFIIEESPLPLSGVKTIKASGGDYPNFTAAITALNEGGVGAGGVTFNVDPNLVSTEDCPAITATGTAVNPIVFQKNGAGANPLIKPTGGVAINDAGIKIFGGDYITFDGIDITIAAGSAVEYGYYIINSTATNGAQYNTIKNSKIILNRTNTSSIGIYQYTNVTPTSVAGANSYNKYYNLTIENVFNGIYLLGTSAYPDLNTEIGVSGGVLQSTIGGSSANDIGNGSSTVYGIRAAQQQNIKIFNCEVRNVTNTSSSLNVHGIFLDGLKSTNNLIYNNNIHDVKCASTTNGATVSGIRADAASGVVINIYNNFVSNISHSASTASSTQYVRGIAANIASGTGTVNLYFNSVRLETTSAISSSCVTNVAGTMNLLDNVLSNVSATGATSKRYCIYLSSGTLSKSNYNDFYINTAGTGNNVGYSVSDKNTLALWQSGTSKDANSKNVDPQFLTSTNLHSISSDLNSAGSTVSIANSDAIDVTTDIDGETRLATPDIGADEFTPLTCGNPTALTSSNISYQSVDLSWNAPTTSSPVGYEWEVRTSGIGGSGSTGLVASGSTVAPTVTASISGLTGGTSYSYYVRTNCGVGDFSLWAGNTFSTNTCNLPTGVSTSLVTSSSATISWIPPVVGSPAGYEYEVRTSGAAGSGSTGLVASGTTSSPIVTASITGLAAATTYNVYVRTSCYAGFYSAWTSSVSFTTACNPEVAPTVVQDFSTYSGTAPQPVCWSEATGVLAASSVLTYGSSEWTSSTGFANTGTNKGVKVNLYSTGSDWIISQPIDLGATAGLYRLKYRMAVTSYNGTVAQSTLGTHKVDIVISTDGGVSWSNTNIIKSYTGVGTYSNTGQDEVINLTAYSGVVKFAFVETTTSSTPDIDFHIDDFVVEALPSCAEPTGLGSSSVTVSSAVLNWTASISLPSSGYDYEVRTSGAAGSGATGLVSSGSTLAGVTTNSVSGLSANTNYNFYVRSNCSTGYSPWAGPSSFYTGYCTPAPSSVDGSGITTVAFSTVSNVTVAESGNYGNYSAMVGDVGQGVLIPVNITFTTGYTYDTKIWIDWNDDLDFLDSGEEVYSGTSTSSSPTTLAASFTVPVSASLGYHRMRIGGVDVGPPTPCYSGTYGSFEDYTVNVVLPPSCPNTSSLAANNITTSGAELSWTENGTASKWDIEYGVTGFPPTGNPTDGFDNVDNNTHFLLEGLNSSTSYSWYVRADCSGDNTDVSAWTGPHTFTTACEVFNVPLTQNFDAVTVPSLPACWSVETHTNAWRPTDERGTSQPDAHSPYNTMTTFYNSTTAKNDWFFTPAMNLQAGVTYKLSFWYLTDGGVYGPEKLEVKYGNSASSAGMSAGQLWNNANMVNGTYQEAVTYFSPSTTDVYYLGWHAYSALDIDFISVDDISITISPVASTWTGATSPDWTNSANWTAGVPGPNTNVIIPGGLTTYPALTATGFCNNLIIQSGAAGTGSIIGNNFLTVAGTTTVERYLTKYNAPGDDMFHFLSSPVSSQAIVPGFQTLTSTDTDLYSWDEVSNNWTNSLLSSGWNPAFENNFTIGKGYLVAYPTDITKTFTGSLNSGNVSPVLTFSSSGSQGWNLVGNPFASAIDWDNVAATQYTNLENAVYVWDNANQSYKTWVAGVGDLVDGIIPAMQGFFVKANAASPALTMKDEDRVNAGSAYYKNGSVIGNMVHLRVDGNNHHDESFIRFADGANTGFDSQLDARKLSGGSQVPELASIAGDTDLAVNALPLSSLSEPVTLSLKVGENGPYTLRLIDNTLSSNYYVTLEDLKTGTMQRMNINPEYSFTASVSDDASRFKLHFKDATSIQNLGAASVFSVKVENGVLSITTDKQLSGKVNVIDIAGRVLATAEMIAGTATHINLSNHTGVYLVSVITSEGTSNQKVLVK